MDGLPGVSKVVVQPFCLPKESIDLGSIPKRLIENIMYMNMYVYMYEAYILIYDLVAKLFTSQLCYTFV